MRSPGNRSPGRNSAAGRRVRPNTSGNESPAGSGRRSIERSRSKETASKEGGSRELSKREGSNEVASKELAVASKEPTSKEVPPAAPAAPVAPVVDAPPPKHVPEANKPTETSGELSGSFAILGSQPVSSVAVSALATRRILDPPEAQLAIAAKRQGTTLSSVGFPAFENDGNSVLRWHPYERLGDGNREDVARAFIFKGERFIVPILPIGTCSIDPGSKKKPAPGMHWNKVRSSVMGGTFKHQVDPKGS